MRTTRQLAHRVLHDSKQIKDGKHPTSFEQRYPDFDPLDGKRHVYYVAPLLNPSGYYRMLLPAQELNKTTTHSAMVGQVHRWNFTRQYNDYDLELNGHLVRWADDVVLPAITTDAEYMIKLIKETNPKARVIMDIDFNFHCLPDHHPASKRLTPEDKEQVIDNLMLADRITAPSHALLDDYLHLMTARYKAKPDMVFLPNLLSELSFQDVLTPMKNTSKRLRLGIVCDATQHKDVVSILSVLQHLQKKYEEAVELILFGWNGKYQREDVLPDLQLSFHKSVGILEFHKVFNDLKLDLVLIPMLENQFNASKSFIKYLECAAFGIPVIASDHSPYREIIYDQHNGLLASTPKDWIQKIEWIIGDSKSREVMGIKARDFAWNELSYNQDAVALLQQTFS